MFSPRSMLCLYDVQDQHRTGDTQTGLHSQSRESCLDLQSLRVKEMSLVETHTVLCGNCGTLYNLKRLGRVTGKEYDDYKDVSHSCYQCQTELCNILCIVHCQECSYYFCRECINSHECEWLKAKTQKIRKKYQDELERV